ADRVQRQPRRGRPRGCAGRGARRARARRRLSRCPGAWAPLARGGPHPGEPQRRGLAGGAAARGRGRSGARGPSPGHRRAGGRARRPASRRRCGRRRRLTPPRRGTRSVTRPGAASPRRVSELWPEAHPKVGPTAFRSRLTRDGKVVAGAGTPARAAGGVVAPQALYGVLLPVVARDVVQPAGNRGRGRDSLGVADPGTLVAVLVRAVVVPAAEIDAVDHVLGARVRDRLLDLVAHDDREPVEPAREIAGVD